MPVLLPRRQPEVSLLTGIAVLHQQIDVLELLLQFRIPIKRRSLSRQQLCASDYQHRVQGLIRLPVLAAELCQARECCDFLLVETFAQCTEDQNRPGEHLGEITHALKVFGLG